MAENPQALVREGIEAARSGDKLTARRLLQQALSYDPDSEVAWMWMASVVDTVEERRRCLERVLIINPNNARAREALTRLGGTAPPRPQPAARAPGADATPNPRVARPVDRTQRRGGLNGYLIAAGVVAVIVVGVVVAAVLNSTGTPITLSLPVAPTSDLDATFQAAFSFPTETSTPTDVPTPTVFGVIVSVQPETRAAQLPPTFTPTFTRVPSDTPTPTATPYPLSVYPLVYSDYPPARAFSALYTNVASGDDEVELANAGFDDLALDPFGTRIAFVRAVVVNNEDGSTSTVQEIYVAPLANPDALSRVTNLGGISGSPAWSADGTALVFVSDIDIDRELFIVELDEDGAPQGEPRQLTDNDHDDIEPHWSPDGTLIAFASEADGADVFEIYTITPDGETITRLTDASGSNTYPRWSPDMSALVFVSDRGGQSDVYIMEPTGDSQRLLTFGDGSAQSRLPAWSPDGRWIAFASDRPVQGRVDKFNWYVMDTRGETVQPMIVTTRTPQSIAFLPNLRLR